MTDILFAASSSGGGSWLAAFGDWSVELMTVVGPAGAGLAIALENLFPPLPSEVVLPLAGLAAGRGAFTLAEALFWTTAGSVVGAYVLYYLGMLLGIERLRRIADKMPLMKVEDVDKTVAWFQRHGWAAVFFGRMLPIFRSLISIPAGVVRMPWWKFGLLTAAGSLIWNSIFVLAGFLLGENWHVVEAYSEVLQWIVIGAVVAVAVWFVVTRVRSLRRDRRAADAS